MYKWDNPFEWLIDKAKNWNENELRSTLYDLALKLDSDTLQDIFQTEMLEDGYFRALERGKEE